jgi:O-antigen ligase
MRVYALYLVIAGISVYAYCDWFKSVCGLVLLMAFVQHPDFPGSVAGIQGLNPWNLALVNVIAGWMLGRKREGLKWDMPRLISHMLLVYLTVVLIGWVRCLLDPGPAGADLWGDLISERLINTIKWVIPGLLLYDGCRSRARLRWALWSVLAVYFLLALQVIRWMPSAADITGAQLNHRALKTILNEVGYHPVNMSMMLAGACWATFSILPLVKTKWRRIGVVLVAITMAYGQALTGGRMGYVTWGVVGLVMCSLRWRKYLLLAPLVVIVITLAVPSAVDRMLQGFDEKTASEEVVTDDYEVTSGRTLIWPYVIEKIMQSPVVGYGRLAMKRTGLSDRLWRELKESFPHPHNAYLEWLLDNGALGFVLVMPFYLLMVWYAVRLFRSSTGPAYVAAGGVCLALVLALLVAAMGSQTFYPREGSVGMWAAIGVMLRLRVAERQLASELSYVAPHAATSYSASTAPPPALARCARQPDGAAMGHWS